MTVENLRIQVDTNAAIAAKNVKKLTDALDSLGKVAASMDGVSQLQSIANAYQSLSAVSKAPFTKLAKGVESVSAALKTLTIDDIITLNQVAAAVKQLDGVDLSGIRNVGSAVKSVSKGVKDTGDAAKKANSPLSTFVTSLKRIAFYRLVRTIIKTLSQAFVEGLKNAYLFSAGLTTEGNRFAAAMDAMNSAATKMKAQLGSAFIGLLAALEPIIVRLVNLVAALADVVSQFFAAFTGTTYLKAADITDTLVDDFQSGAKAAKEWKNQLLGFDEINKLTDNRNGGGISPSNLFGGTDAPINPKILELVERIKNAFNDLDFGPLKTAAKLLREDLGVAVDNLGTACSWLWENVLSPFIAWVIEDLAPVVLKVVDSVVKLYNAVSEKLGPVIDKLWKEVLQPVCKWVGDNIIFLLEDLSGLLTGLADLISGKQSFEEFWNSLSESQKWLGIVLSAVVLLKGIKGIMGLGSAMGLFAADPATKTIAVLGAVAVAGYLLIKNWDKLKTALGELKTKWSDTWGNGKIEFADFAYATIELLLKVMEEIEKVYNWAKKLIDFFNGVGPNGGRVINSKNVMGGTATVGGTTVFGDSEFSHKSGSFDTSGLTSASNAFVSTARSTELLASLGGSTNSTPVADGVSKANDGVISAVYTMMNAVVGAIENKDSDISVDGASLARALYAPMRNEERRRGGSLVVGGVY